MTRRRIHSNRVFIWVLIISFISCQESAVFGQNATLSPTASPTLNNTTKLLPTISPTSSPESSEPTTSPTISPTTSPVTPSPTLSPSLFPTRSPLGVNETHAPTNSPTISPTSSPTWAPTLQPTRSPLEINGTYAPTGSPTLYPTRSPLAFNTTHSPTGTPSISPTQSPLPNNETHAPTTDEPTNSPTLSPSLSPTNSPTSGPTESPTIFYGFYYSEWTPCDIECGPDSNLGLVAGTKYRNATCHRGEGEFNGDGSTGDPNGEIYPVEYCGTPSLQTSCHGSCNAAVGGTLIDSPGMIVVLVVSCGAVVTMGVWGARGRVIRRHDAIHQPAHGPVEPFTGSVEMFGGAGSGTTEMPYSLKNAPPPPPPRGNANSTLLARPEARRAAETRRFSLFPQAQPPPASHLQGPEKGQGALSLSAGSRWPSVNEALKDEIRNAYMIRTQLRPNAPRPPPLGLHGTLERPVRPKASPEQVEELLDTLHMEASANRVRLGITRAESDSALEVSVALKERPTKPSKPIYLSKPMLAHAIAQADEVDKAMGINARPTGRRSSFDFAFEEAVREALKMKNNDEPNKKKLNERYTNSMEPFFKQDRLARLGATLPRSSTRKHAAGQDDKSNLSVEVVVGHGVDAPSSSTLPRRSKKGKSLRKGMLKSLTRGQSNIPSHFSKEIAKDDKTRRTSVHESKNPVALVVPPPPKAVDQNSEKEYMELHPALDPLNRPPARLRGKAEIRAADLDDFPVPLFVGDLGDDDENTSRFSLSSAASFMSSISVRIAKANAKANSNRAKPTTASEEQVEQQANTTTVVKKKPRRKHHAKEPAPPKPQKPLSVKLSSKSIKSDAELSITISDEQDQSNRSSQKSIPKSRKTAPPKPHKPLSVKMSSLELLNGNETNEEQASRPSSKRRPKKPSKPLHMSVGSDLV